MVAEEYRITLPDEELLAAEVGRTRQAMELRDSMDSDARIVGGTLAVESHED